ncbi:hypothetical protein N0V83_003054 [Neocucurbitaria cava]|uniref:Asl1-like glycosyl hydrolase catalytic domain-containing protein n=1 Tax=Neocucurbitaria cava TaxID=798079 RepID=A0A9W9CQ41_9PLEO|nr:hypothetical protein N0V83_003054 [Neocucurbitaria cava]
MALLAAFISLANAIPMSYNNTIFPRVDPEIPAHERRGIAFNNPDFVHHFAVQPSAGGACMSVADAVAGWNEHIQPLKSLKKQMYLGSPAVSNAAATDSTGLGWLAKFIEACSGCDVDFINIHWYDRADNAAYFKQHIEDARKVAQGRPIWVTEFRAEGTDEQVKRFFDEVLPWMDGSSDVARYAYFMARPGPGMLINDAQDGLSDLGAYYSFHDP